MNNEPYRNIVERYGVTLGAVNRHATAHVPATLTRAAAAADVAHADTLLAQVQTLHTRTLAILQGAEKAKEYRTALMAIREARGNLELLAKLLGELNEGAVVNVLVNPEWHHVRTVMVEALSPYPEARVAVAAALEQVDHAA